MKKTTLTEDKAEQTPTGGVLVGKRKGQTIIHDKGTMSGYLVGKTHAEGGIKAVNKSTGQPLEMQGGEVVITAPAVSDQTKNEFNGKMMTNREILSQINVNGGGVAFADGGDISKVKHTGASYNYGGRTMTDYEIIQEINSCGCEHSDYKKGGHLAEGLSLRDIADIHNISIAELKKQVRTGLKAESEHTSSKREQMKIVKDHLLENPKYYTLLQKSGLAKGGLIAPNGNKSNLTAEQYKLVRTPEFKEWFGDWENNPKNASKVVDENGEPLVVYHGTKDEFYEFDVDKQRIGWLGKGFYFTEDKRFSKDFGKRVIKSFLNLRNPFIVQADTVNDDGSVNFSIGREAQVKEKYGYVNSTDISETLKENNVDGVIEGDMLSCFYPNQIKLADGTNTTFNSSSNDIRYDKGGQMQKEDLVRDSKSGNTPARDLNNYNDVLDVDADGVVGAETGLYANGGDVDFDVDGTGGADASSGVGAFDNGGEVGSFLNYYFEELKDFLKTQNNIILNDDYTFYYKGEKFTIEPTILSDTSVSESIKEANFIVYDLDDEIVGNIEFNPNANKKFIANSEFFEWNNKKFEDGGEVMKTNYRILNSEGKIKYTGTEMGSWFSLEKAKKIVDYSKGEMIYEYDNNGEKLYEVFKDGGEVTNPMVSNWDNINSSWKDTSKVKKIVWANNPYDKGLYSIVAPYLGKDELRPVMSGINFDENGITATNAHVLITLPYPNKKYEGIYEPDLSKRKDSDQITIDGKYPNYSAVIPFSDDTTHFLIDVYKLLQYTNVALKYANKTTYQIAYKINNEAVGFNGRFMVENLKTLLKLGHEKVYANYIAPNKAMILSPSKDYRVGNDEIILVMPVMLKEKFYGARDYEWDNKVSRELSVYFDFDDNEIHNADGSVVDFKMKYENNSAVDVEDVKLLESMVKKNKTLQILNYVVVKDNTLRVTNLKADYVVKNVSLPDGIYLPSNGNLEITMNPIDDYPREAVFVSDEDTIEFTIPSTVFEYYIDRFKFVLDQDDLRPIFKGISLKHTSDNKLFLLGTDSHLGLKIDITKYVDIPLYNREIQTVIDPLWLFAFLDKLEEGALHIKSNKVATIIDSESKSFYCRNIDGNYPNLEAVIPQTSDDLVSIEYSALKKCLNNEFMKNYKRHTDKYEMVGVFDKAGELFVGRRSKQVTNPEFKDVEKLCDVTFKSSKEEYRYDGQSVLLAMPLIAEQQDNFIFDEELLSKVMTIVNDSVIQMHHNGTKRAFLIPIHSFEYEKTTIEHKTREQKPTIEQEQIIAEVEEIDEIKEAIEVMQMLLETAPKKDKKEIVEAIEVMEMLLESYQN